MIASSIQRTKIEPLFQYLQESYQEGSEMIDKENSADLVKLLKSQFQEYDANEGKPLLQFKFFLNFLVIKSK